jgi:hypothetical protein
MLDSEGSEDIVSPLYKGLTILSCRHRRDVGIACPIHYVLSHRSLLEQESTPGILRICWFVKSFHGQPSHLPCRITACFGYYQTVFRAHFLHRLSETYPLLTP